MTSFGAERRSVRRLSAEQWIPTATLRAANEHGAPYTFSRTSLSVVCAEGVLRCARKRITRVQMPTTARLAQTKMRIGRAGLEASVLLGLKTQLMRAEMVKDFITEYHSELNRLRSAEHQELSAQRDELARTERGIRAIIEAIKDGIRSPGMREELLALEDRKEQLAATLKNARSSVVRMHPNLAEIYREKVSNLHIALTGDDTRGQAAEALRSLISEVRLIPENGRLEIELVGDLPAMLAFANGTPRRADPAGRITMVAGEGFEPPTLGL
jgi:site-specific DNA recombinase